MPYNPYAPIERGLAGIGGTLERGAARRSEHETRMGMLGLQGERLGMEGERLGMARETHGLEMGIKGLQLGALERTEKGRKETEKAMGELSGLRSWDSYEDTVGPDPQGKKRQWLMEIIPENKQIVNEAGEIVGFDVKRKEVPAIATQLIGRMDPMDLAENRKYLLHNRDWLINYAGATKDGKDKHSQALRATDNRLKMANDLLTAYMKNPLAGSHAKWLLTGGKGMSKAEIEAKDLFINVQTLKAKGKQVTWGQPFAGEEGGLYQLSSAGKIAKIKGPEKGLTAKQTADAPLELRNDYFQMTHTQNANKEWIPIDPAPGDLVALQRKAQSYGFDMVPTDRMMDTGVDLPGWGTGNKMVPEYDFVPMVQDGQGLQTTGGPPQGAVPSTVAPVQEETPFYIQNPTTGEIRQWNPATGEYVTVQAPAQGYSGGAGGSFAPETSFLAPNLGGRSALARPYEAPPYHPAIQYVGRGVGHVGDVGSQITTGMQRGLQGTRRVISRGNLPVHQPKNPTNILGLNRRRPEA